MVTIAVGVQDRPTAAPKDGIWVSDYKLVGSPSFSQAISAASSIIYAYAGTPGELADLLDIFSFISSIFWERVNYSFIMIFHYKYTVCPERRSTK